jgi:hypothetical protein
MAGTLMVFIYFWLQALFPRDYSQQGRPRLVVVTAFFMSILMLILGLVVGAVVIYFWNDH